tara:strand:- start:385 stop:807 length:423 start_codon:yes stop_codon:yes gene_type:complete
MNYSETLLNNLEEIVNKGLEDAAIPYAKGNSIRIKNIIIRKSPNGYLVYNCTENTQVARTQFKTTAVAIAKNLAEGKDIRKQVLELDETMLKHYNDALFYKHSIRKSTDPDRREIREARLDIAILESKRLRSLLDRFIFC